MAAAVACEWRGQSSSKFGDMVTGNTLLRRSVETSCRNGDTANLARQGFDSYFSDTRGLVCSEGRRHMEEPSGDVMGWRPSRRAMGEPGACHFEKPEGRRLVEGVTALRPKTLPEKRHIQQVESKEEYGDRAAGPHTVYRSNGLRAADQPATEVDLSSEMARKLRPLDLIVQRNGIGCKALGDKCYRHPEYGRSFFKIGGLVIGSSFHRGHFKRTEARSSASVQLATESLQDVGKKKNYKEAREEKLREATLKEVQELSHQWESKTLKNFMDVEQKQWYTKKLGFFDEDTGVMEKDDSDDD